jgi:F0F1-type ATP synthase membrane subunit c/vacuolar-type H+-ATPase subunit K
MSDKSSTEKLPAENGGSESSGSDKSSWYMSLIGNGGSIASGLGNLAAGIRGQTNNAGSKTVADSRQPVADSKNAGNGVLIGLGIAGAVTVCIVLFLVFKNSK